MKINRSEVYATISRERDYQDLNIKVGKWERVEHHVSAEIVLMEVYLTKARDAWANFKGDEAALHEIRKIAALAVRCMENHGAPQRDDARLPAQQGSE